MRRVMYVYLPEWPIDRRRRSLSLSHRGAAPADEPAFATLVESGGRRLLAAVNPAAAAAGLAPGMPLADALSFLPVLHTAPAEPEADAAALLRLAQWCTRYSPWTAPDGSDGIKIEITGCGHLWGSEETLAADLARRLLRQGIGHRLAIAGTLGAAWALARFAAASGRPSLPSPGAEKAALAPLPVAALRLDPATAAGLGRVGLQHIGELYPMPRDALARRFGAHGLENAVTRRLDQALGELPEPLSPLGETPARRVRLSFAEPIADPADLARATERLTGDLAARLARDGQGARRLALAFHRIDGRVEEIRLGTARPSRDPQHLAGLFIAKLDTVDPGLGVEDMILALFAAEPLMPEQIGIDRRCDPAASGLAPLVDRLGARLGLAAISRLAARASHIPERASVSVPFDTARRNQPGAQTADRPPRPIRLFAPPEPIEASWLLPDDPPFRFTWRRRSHRVRRADGPERIADEWWIAGGSAAADAIRDYYRVEDTEGRRFWLFRAGLPGFGPDGAPPPRWFVHGVFA
ncbi:MAG TPA: DNA polymerase Y family protein [Stellaceae bacterium]|nr:DNA polymerase Y family protein [Stellaceae bacterium]